MLIWRTNGSETGKNYLAVAHVLSPTSWSRPPDNVWQNSCLVLAHNLASSGERNTAKAIFLSPRSAADVEIKQEFLLRTNKPQQVKFVSVRAHPNLFQRTVSRSTVYSVHHTHICYFWLPQNVRALLYDWAQLSKCGLFYASKRLRCDDDESLLQSN